ncbi:hypothetical protein GCM10017562_19800 [Streptomyces roseofulvus]
MVLDPLERQTAHGQRGAQRQMEGAGVQQLHQIGLGVAHTGSSVNVHARARTAAARTVGGLVDSGPAFTLAPHRSQPDVTPH